MDTYFHGTAKRFSSFDSRFVGQGEQAQKYGWGMYLVRSPETADSYRDRVGTLQPGNAVSYTLGPLVVDEQDPRSEQLLKFARDNDPSALTDPELVEHAEAHSLQIQRGLIVEVDGPDFESLPDWDDVLTMYWSVARAIAEDLYGDVVEELLEEAQEYETMSGPMDFEDKFTDFVALRDPHNAIDALEEVCEGCPDYDLRSRISQALPKKLTIEPDGTFGNFYEDLVHVAGSNEAAAQLLISQGIPGARMTMKHPAMSGEDDECVVVWDFERLLIREHHRDLDSIDYQPPVTMAP